MITKAAMAGDANIFLFTTKHLSLDNPFKQSTLNKRTSDVDLAQPRDSSIMQLSQDLTLTKGGVGGRHREEMMQFLKSDKA